MRWWALALWLVLLLGGCQRLFAIEEFRHDAPVVRGDVLLSDGLVAYYSMDVLVDGVLRDDFPGGHDGHCNASMTCPVFFDGKHAGALKFDGMRDRIEVGNIAELEPASITVAGWIWLDMIPPQTTCPFNKILGTADGNSWQLCVFTDGQLDYITTHGGLQTADTLFSGSSTVLDANNWHHVAITFDGQRKQLWLDGSLVVMRSVPTPLAYDGSPLSLGADRDYGNTVAEFAGLIDDVRIYNRTLPQDDMLVLATGP